MQIITLTTDTGLKDFYHASLKGTLYRLSNQIQIVDISHDITPFDISETAFQIKSCYNDFPIGTIHIIGVESELTPENIHLAMEFEGHFFIGADNGIFSLIKEGLKAKKTVAINIHNSVVTSFPVLDVFIHVAAHIARNGTLEVIGNPIKEIRELTNVKPVINPEGNQILGSVIYIDNYGNVVTNITLKLFKEIGKTRPFTIALFDDKLNLVNFFCN